MTNKLFTPINLGEIHLDHRIVMAPTTRMRAEAGNVPGKLMVEHYRQRANKGGLIIAEATSISPYANAYADSPGIFNDSQMAGWKKVVDAVHARGASIILQIWHTGRQTLPELSQGHQPVAPSALTANNTYGVGKDSKGEYEGKLFPAPRALELNEIASIINDFGIAAKRAKEAGFDGVELQCANGYLPEQFLLDGSNHRQDQYGGSIENRARFLLEVVAELIAVFGTGRVGVRISPSGIYGDMKDSAPKKTFTYLAQQLSHVGLAYLHIIEPRVVGPEDRQEGVYEDPVDTKDLRPYFTGNIISAGGFTPESAEKMLESGDADLIAFARLFTSNPDLPERIKHGYPLTHYDRSTFFGGDAVGYTNFPDWAHDPINSEKVK